MAGLFVVFGLFHGLATILESDRGQRGILIAIVVVITTAAADRFLLRRPYGSVLDRLGLGRPRATGIAAAVSVSIVLLAVAIVFSRSRGMTPAFYPGWLWLLPGLFAQAGVAEEVLFRGYLFGRVRTGRSFWRAANLSMLPFVAVHVMLFFSMPWPIALASVLLSVVISFPFAYFYELGGRTIWAPAILHFVIQATVKVIVFPEAAASFALLWMAASAIVPMLVFAVKAPDRP